MSEAVAPALTLRGDAAAAARRNMASVRSLERERRVLRLVTTAGPLALCACLTALVVSDRYERAAHPVPQPEILVAMVRANGISPPVAAADLTPSDEAAVLSSTIANYIAARESYCFTCQAKNYRHVSAISSPEERSRYQTIMLNDKDPRHPAKTFGTGEHAGEATVDPTRIEVTQDRTSPNVFTAVFQVTIAMPNTQPRTVTKLATMQWLPAKDKIDPRDRQAFSPLGIGCWSYNSYVMEAPR